MRVFRGKRIIFAAGLTHGFTGEGSPRSLHSAHNAVAAIFAVEMGGSAPGAPEAS